MRAALYSDQVIPQNRQVDAALRQLLPRGGKVGFVPSAGDPTGTWFAERRAYYIEAGLDLVHAHDPAKDGPDSLEHLLSCDAIHLSGGDTTAFRSRLWSSGMADALRAYAKKDGVLIGTSAGAILLTPTIAVDAIFHSQTPDPHSRLVGLQLVSFEFFPHLDNDAAYLPALIDYSRSAVRPVVGCPDGSGITIDGDDVRFVGPGVVVAGGEVRDWSDGFGRSVG